MKAADGIVVGPEPLHLEGPFDQRTEFGFGSHVPPGVQEGHHRPQKAGRGRILQEDGLRSDLARDPREQRHHDIIGKMMRHAGDRDRVRPFPRRQRDGGEVVDEEFIPRPGVALARTGDLRRVPVHTDVPLRRG